MEEWFYGQSDVQQNGRSGHSDDPDRCSAGVVGIRSEDKCSDRRVLPSVFADISPRKQFLPTWSMQSPMNTLTLPYINGILRNEDPECVLVVKRLNRLGFDSSPLVLDHFRQFGNVKGLLLLPCRSRDGPRPSSMCFIVMTNKHEAIRALTSCHMIKNIELEVNVFIPLS